MSNANFMSLNAAADFLGPGAVEVPMFENEILDIVTRTSVALQRFDKRKATGQPHRYFEQTAISSGAFQDPRAMAPVVTGPTRVERYASIKAITNQTNIAMFDREVTQQQGQFESVVAEDIEDVASGITITSAVAVWAGTDTSLTTPTTLQYVGLLTQITTKSIIAPGASIIDGLKLAVANLVSNPTYNVAPTAFYVSPLLSNYIDAEAKAANITFGNPIVVAGVSVRTIATAAGLLPLIEEKFIPSTTDTSYGFTAPPAGNKNYFAAIITERLIEMPHISGLTDNPYPRLFQLGLTNSLSGQYVGVLYNCIIAKGFGYAHAVVAVQRP